MTELLLGIDGGGTGCRAVVTDKHGAILGRSTGGPANITTDFEEALANIVRAARSAIIDTGLDSVELESLHSVIGVAGANVGNSGRQLAEKLPFQSTFVENDSTIAVRGALGKSDGIVAAIGTGSIFAIQQRAAIRTIGGWGNVVSDQASGVWLGKRLLHDTLLCFDGIYTESPLYTETMAHFNHSAQSIVTFARDATPADFASFAKAVMDHATKADAIALQIVKTAIADIELILSKLSDNRTLPLCLLGSLGARYSDHLSDHFRNRLQAPAGDAVSGAVALAVERYSGI